MQEPCFSLNPPRGLYPYGDPDDDINRQILPITTVFFYRVLKSLSSLVSNYLIRHL